MGQIQESDARRAGVTDEAVLRAMAAVPRELFVPEGADADRDAPVPIGEGQTTSQPSLVALSLQHLQVEPHHRVLDVGAGSGYQSALLAHVAQEVIGLEVRPDLAAAAAARLRDLRLGNVRVEVGDGWAGLPQAAPFDRIVVGAEAEEVPQALLDQLVPGGRMVIPVGSRGTADLLLVTTDEDGTPHTRSLLAVRFVPLVRGDG